MASKTDIIIFGATGFTGKLITEYLASHPQRSSFSLGVAARSATRLQKVIEDLGLSQQDIRLVILDVTDPESVEEAVKCARVVINTIGPYWRWGTAVVGSCVRNQVHYVDLTGEGPWIKQIITQFDWLATRKHTVIVPSCGYDSIPSDISAYLANKTFRHYVSVNHPGTHAVGLHTSISAHRLKTGVSGGTLASFMTAIEEVPPMLRKESRNPYFISPMKGTPLPFPKLVYTLPVPHETPVVGAMFVMRASNTAIVHRTAGLLEYHARAARADGKPDRDLEQQSYGPSFVYDEFLASSSKLSAWLTSASIIFGLMLVGLVTPVRALVKKLMLQSGEGPGLDQKDKGYLHLTNISTSVPTNTIPSLKVRTDIKIKGDPGYYKTAVMISESALSLLLPPVSALPEVKQGYNAFDALPSLAKEGGVLTSMTAFGDVLIQRLRDTGSFEFDSRIVEDQGLEDRKRV